ncbi:hypothetical protein GCM10010210_13270 [Pseudonocardia hydrocarbonoxydans]|uniref:CAAX prenyl protease 2/Lysostaphin resistance protein A-like domain-containing protein n=1 Tax=Pseudonocardia hydrocarbonoxydans TaxID=76726 RepID=A0A4Y3WQG4_9PSEU|nr:hypothetical protein PHY01_32970 [Pseudonocardia hydrocarbonoxydans]
MLGVVAVVAAGLLWRRSRAGSVTGRAAAPPVVAAPPVAAASAVAAGPPVAAAAVEPVGQAPSWFDAPVPTDTATPPMGIPISAPERSPGAAGPAGEVTDPALRLPAGLAAGPSEVTDPALRLPAGSGRPPGEGPGEVTDRIPVVTPAGAPPPAARPVFPGAAVAGAAGPGAAVPDVVAPPAPRPPHRWGLGAYLVAEAVFLGVSALMGLALIGQDPVTAGALAAALGVPTVAAALTGLLVTWVRGNGPVVDLQLSPTARDVGLGLAFGFGGLFLTIPASLVYVSVVGEDASSAVGDVFGGVTAAPATALLIVVIVVLVAPLCEEILYRGLLWGGLTRLGANRWLAFAVTTVIFALAHFEWPRALLLLVVALPLGLARVYSDGLLAPVIAHQVNNLLPGIGLYLMLTGAFPAL